MGIWYWIVALATAIFLTFISGYKKKEIGEENCILVGMVVILASCIWPIFWAMIAIINIHEFGKAMRARKDGKVSANSRR